MTTSRISTALVLGASGLQGGAASRALLAAGLDVRGGVRDPDGANGLAVSHAGAEPVRVDFADPSSLRDAMHGVDLVFSVQPSSGQPGSGVTDEQEVAAGLAVVEATEVQGVRHLVYSSALAARVGRTGVAHFDTKAVIEDRVRRSSQGWTIVRPATFMEMVVEPDAIPREVVRFLMPDDAPLAVVAVDDIGRSVAQIASNPESWAGAEVDLVGDLVTGTEIARLVADRVGAPVRYEQLDLTNAPPDAARPGAADRRRTARGRARQASLGAVCGDAGLRKLARRRDHHGVRRRRLRRGGRRPCARAGSRRSDR